MHVSHMKEWFLARGYSKIVLNNQIDKVVFSRDKSVFSIWKVTFLLLLLITLGLKSLGN